MNTQKWKMGNLGLLYEADRTMYKGKDTMSKSIIDPSRTHMNYNLCPHEQYTAREVKAINRTIRGKEVRKDAVAWGSTVITLPKDYTGDTKAFFETAYKGLKRMYGLKDEDIISAYVHLDETSPHMHFYFIPVKHEEAKDCVSWEKVMPRKMYQTQHRVLQEYMSSQLQTEVNLLNGETKGVSVQGLTADQKKASMALEKTQEAVKIENESLVSVQLYRGELDEELHKVEKRLKAMKAEVSGLEEKAKEAESRAKKAEQNVAKIGTKLKDLIGKDNDVREALKQNEWWDTKTHQRKVKEKQHMVFGQGIEAYKKATEGELSLEETVDALDNCLKKMDRLREQASNGGLIDGLDGFDDDWER